ncbi:MAG: 23S rRNA (uracil(1939)-C(5))-methyltransferase RlmD [Planctomycetes bacterium]|nr:23S rRNA (uracil(1939)-C(5))-methyltransferase RlmD [Planctomycetota bacterium]
MDSETVRIERLAAGGEGVGRLADGRVVFVPRTAQGDLVALRGIVRKARFARADVAELVERSPDRAEPRCVHFVRDRCGGCALQHVAPDAQVRAKAAIVGDALRRIGKLDVPDPPVEPAASPWGWRSRIVLTQRGGVAGFHPEGEPGRVFMLERCEIAAPPLSVLWSEMRGRGPDALSRTERITLRVERDGGTHAILHHDHPGFDGAPWRAPLACGASVWEQRAGAAARLLSGPGSGAAPTAFEQVDAAAGERIRRFAVERAGDLSGAVAWDLYAGTGATSALLAARGARVEAVEADEAAADSAAVRSLPGTVRFTCGRAEDVAASLPRPRVVVTNPSRSGMDERACEAVAASGAERIVYVSCDPATLARDLRRLGADASRLEVRAFDAFPQTAHVETVAVLARTVLA